MDVPLLLTQDVDHYNYTLSAWVRYTGPQNDRTPGAAGERWRRPGPTDERPSELTAESGLAASTSAAPARASGNSGLLGARHLAATYAGAALTVYFDGHPAGSEAVTGRTCASGEPLAVGAKNKPDNRLVEAFRDGRLDDVRLYSRALSTVRRSSSAPC